MAETKTCYKCSKEKPIDAFYKQKSVFDGYANKCKECAKADARANYRKNHEHYLQYERLRRTSEKRKAKAIQDCKRIRAEHPEKFKAHSAVSAAKRSGKLVQQPCEICGASRTFAHHDDYSKPLDVIWLCPQHHKWIHA